MTSQSEPGSRQARAGQSARPVKTRRPASPARLPTAMLDYWQGRMTCLSYTAPARPGSEKELFAGIKYDGRTVYFPLDSHRPETAAVRASEIYRTLTEEGWQAVRQRYVRQITWVVYWFTEPLACTYATLFTVTGPPGGAGKPIPPAGSALAVAVVEADAEVRRALEQAIQQMPGYTCVATTASARALLQPAGSPAGRPQLVLYNQRTLDLGVMTLRKQLESRWPGIIMLAFDIFGHSDEAFMSLTGMERGYFLRRRLPMRMLEPLEACRPMEEAGRKQLRPKLATYFQKLFSSPDHDRAGQTETAGTLSEREMEVLRCLCAGHTDKSLAAFLGISVWTAHAHIKKIFTKLGVHTRAEAVTHYLQR